MNERPFVIISRAIEQTTGEPVSSSGDALCPAHEDENPSLSITEDREGKVLMKCHAGCSFSDIMHALGLEEKDAFPERQNGREILETYDYVDENGELLLQAVRYLPKDFRQRRPDGKGGWIWKTKGVRRVLYRLPRVLEASAAGRVVFVTEGEKDVHALERQGLTATTNLGGASKKWLREYSESLRGAHVVIIPDNDEPGRSHAERIARSVHGMAASVRILELPDLPEKGDVSDWLAAGGTKEGLQRLAKEAPIYEPSDDTTNVISERPGFQNTDLGNAERLVHTYGANLLFCHVWGSWLAFNGPRWEKDATGTVDRYAYDLVRTMQKEAVEITDDDSRSSAMKWARTSQSAAKLRSMVSLAESMVPVLPKDLDTDPFALNVDNKTIDLRTGEARPHRKEDLITKLAPVTYDPKATCPRWNRHLLEIFSGNEDLSKYFQRLAGYSATGDVSEQIIAILFGFGANGKGTTINTLMHVLGDYAQSTRPELLLSKRVTNGPSPGEAALKGSRFVSTSESGSGQKFDEATVKRLTGGDRIRARFNHQDEFEFEPTHKLWFSTNHKPVIEGTDYAIWRRIHLIPFTVTFTEEKRDPDLEEKLKAEASGILNWIIEGCLMWQSEGLNPPAAVQDATSEYRSEMDVLAAFLEDCCETGISEMQVASSRLYDAYKAWCDRTGERAERQRGFGLRMTERGFERDRKRDGYYYVGIGLKSSRQGSHDDPQEGDDDVPF